VKAGQVQLLTGGTFQDERGKLCYVNQFEYQDVKRFYQTMHFDTSVVRVWQEHQIEVNFSFSEREFLVIWLKIDD
jgi:hypothetical protein